MKEQCFILSMHTSWIPGGDNAHKEVMGKTCSCFKFIRMAVWHLQYSCVCVKHCDDL